MKVQANTSVFFGDRLPHHESSQDEVIEMITENGIDFVPKPPLMLSYCPLDVSGIIVEDRLPAFAPSVIEKYEAAARLWTLKTRVHPVLATMA